MTEANPNPAVPAEVRCTTCFGWGWNQDIRNNPVDIVAPLTEDRSLRALKDYILKRIGCPDCAGTGRSRK